MNDVQYNSGSQVVHDKCPSGLKESFLADGSARPIGTNTRRACIFLRFFRNALLLDRSASRELRAPRERKRSPTTAGGNAFDLCTNKEYFAPHRLCLACRWESANEEYSSPSHRLAVVSISCGTRAGANQPSLTDLAGQIRALVKMGGCARRVRPAWRRRSSPLPSSSERRDN